MFVVIGIFNVMNFFFDKFVLRIFVGRLLIV